MSTQYVNHVRALVVTDSVPDALQRVARVNEVLKLTISPGAMGVYGIRSPASKSAVFVVGFLGRFDTTEAAIASQRKMWAVISLGFPGVVLFFDVVPESDVNSRMRRNAEFISARFSSSSSQLQSRA